MIRVYEDQFKKHGYSPSSLGCAKGRQDLRFKALTKNIKKGKLLDFGCGFGDLAIYLDKFNSSVNTYYNSDTPVVILGFTYVLYLYGVLPFKKENKKLHQETDQFY